MRRNLRTLIASIVATLVVMVPVLGAAASGLTNSDPKFEPVSFLGFQTAPDDMPLLTLHNPNWTPVSFRRFTSGDLPDCYMLGYMRNDYVGRWHEWQKKLSDEYTADPDAYLKKNPFERKVPKFAALDVMACTEPDPSGLDGVRTTPIGIVAGYDAVLVPTKAGWGYWVEVMLPGAYAVHVLTADSTVARPEFMALLKDLSPAKASDMKKELKPRMSSLERRILFGGS